MAKYILCLFILNITISLKANEVNYNSLKTAETVSKLLIPKDSIARKMTQEFYKQYILDSLAFIKLDNDWKEYYSNIENLQITIVARLGFNDRATKFNAQTPFIEIIDTNCIAGQVVIIRDHSKLLLELFIEDSEIQVCKNVFWGTNDYLTDYGIHHPDYLTYIDHIEQMMGNRKSGIHYFNVPFLIDHAVLLEQYEYDEESWAKIKIISLLKIEENSNSRMPSFQVVDLDLSANISHYDENAVRNIVFYIKRFEYQNRFNRVANHKDNKPSELYSNVINVNSISKIINKYITKLYGGNIKEYFINKLLSMKQTSVFSSISTNLNNVGLDINKMLVDSTEITIIPALTLRFTSDILKYCKDKDLLTYLDYSSNSIKVTFDVFYKGYRIAGINDNGNIVNLYSYKKMNKIVTLPIAKTQWFVLTDLGVFFSINNSIFVTIEPNLVLNQDAPPEKIEKLLLPYNIYLDKVFDKDFMDLIYIK